MFYVQVVPLTQDEAHLRRLEKADRRSRLMSQLQKLIPGLGKPLSNIGQQSESTTTLHQYSSDGLDGSHTLAAASVPHDVVRKGPPVAPNEHIRQGIMDAMGLESQVTKLPMVQELLDTVAQVRS
jgi:hypothetical protein